MSCCPSRLRRGGRSLGGSLSWSTPQPLAPFDEKSPFRGLAVPDDVQGEPPSACRSDRGVRRRSLGHAGRRHPTGDRGQRGPGLYRPVPRDCEFRLVEPSALGPVRRDAPPRRDPWSEPGRRSAPRTRAPPRSKPRRNPQPAPPPPRPRYRRSRRLTGSASSARRRSAPRRSPPTRSTRSCPAPSIRPAIMARQARPMP